MKSNKERIAILLLLIFVLQFFPVFRTQVIAESTFEEAKEGIVQVLTVCYEDGKFSGYRNGSGFAVGEPGDPVRFILTNYYIIDPSVWPQGSDVQVFVGVDDDLMDVSNIYRNSDSDADLALLELENPITNRRNLTFTPSNTLLESQSLSSLSYEDLLSDEGDYMFYLEDIIINEGQLIDAAFLAEDDLTYLEVGITPPNDTFYGGPLVTEEGYVVGINTNNHKDDLGVRNALAIPSEYLINYLMGIDVVPLSVKNSEENWSPAAFGKAVVSIPGCTPNVREGYLSGVWGTEPISTKTGGASVQSAYYLDTPVYDCNELTVEIGIKEFTGYIYDWWYLDARDLNGNWSHVGSFKLDESAIGDGQSYVVKMKKPVSFDALSVVLSSKYNSASWSYNTLLFKDPK